MYLRSPKVAVSNLDTGTEQVEIVGIEVLASVE
jgi:hypothetical protein